MRTLLLSGLVVSLTSLPATVRAQALATQPSQASAAQSAAPAQAPAAAAEESRSLFAPAPRQFQIGGRFSSVDGDPARWQRYEDLRDGVLFTDARYERAWGQTGQLFRATADNVGYRDQKYTGLFERPGRFRANFLWDEIPQFYSVDTRTAFTSGGPGVELLPDAAQLAVQNGQAGSPPLNVYLPISPQFDLRERRDVGLASVTVTPNTNLDLFTSFKTQRHVGELPWGASFGFGNDVEVPLPYNSRANDLTLGAEWTNQRNMLRVAYDGSWFDNHDDTLVWDSPLRLTDSTSAPGRGRMSLWPSNQSQTVSLGGFTKLAHRTQVTGFVSYGLWSNDSVLQPFTINSTLPTLTLPRQETDAEAHVFSTNLNVVSRPVNEWRLSARYRLYDYANETPHADIPQFINYDTSVTTSPTGGPELYAHSRQTFTADATWTGMAPLALAVGYTHNHNGYDFRIFDSAGEDILTLTGDVVGLPRGSVRAQFELADRTGSGLDEALLVQIGEQPAMRHYDLADRSRKKFTGIFDFLPKDNWVLSANAGFGKDNYDDSYFGLQESSFRVFGVGVDYQQPNGFGGGGSYNYERYAGFQTSRSASPGQENDPLRDWTTDSKESVHYFSIYLSPPRFRRNTETRLTYDFSDARANYVYGVVAGGPLPPPSQLPEAYNKLQELRIDVRHRLNNRLAVTGRYDYEPFRVFDFALDPSVVDSIVQPSSLVLGYVYRPYTAHSGIVSLLYFW
jgi:MtrB/PioB family decaheme-associated outer membrane protein